MFEWCSITVVEDPVAALEGRMAEARRDKVERFGRAADEDDLGRVPGV